MNKMDPITDKDIVHEIEDYLREWNEMYFLLFEVALYTGFRITDILSIRVRDVQGWDIKIKEKKTGKVREVRMTPELKKNMRDFVKGKPLNQFVFKSREGKNNPISRQRFDQILKQVVEDLEIDNIAAHSIRKTFGYFYYQKFNGVNDLMSIFNHSSERTTLIYIGDKQVTFKKNMTKFKI